MLDVENIGSTFQKPRSFNETQTSANTLYLVNFQIYFCWGFHFHEIVNTSLPCICAEPARWEAAGRDSEREGASDEELLVAGEGGGGAHDLQHLTVAVKFTNWFSVGIVLLLTSIDLERAATHSQMNSHCSQFYWLWRFWGPTFGLFNLLGI